MRLSAPITANRRAGALALARYTDHHWFDYLVEHTKLSIYRNIYRLNRE